MAKLRYVSLFSGIEAVSCALDHEVWEPVAFSEIDPFPSAVLAHHYPDVPNLGDITKIDWTPHVDTIDVVWGGSPCQSFSLAGDRSGLKGASGLMFEFIRAVRELRPRWFVWENVPGALSSENGNAFRKLLQSMDEGGYGLAWRVLDAQFFGVAQRRERVFLVGSLGTMRCSDVLFEREGVPWDYSSSREKRKALAGRSADGVGTSDRGVGDLLTPGESQLNARSKPGQDQRSVYVCQTAHSRSNGLGVAESDVMNTLDTDNSNAVAFYYSAGSAAGSLGSGDVSPTLKQEHNPAVMCRADTQANAPEEPDMAPTLMAHASHDAPYIYRKAQTPQIRSDMADGSMTVRRLTPMECERLQGFPDGWTDISYKGKPHPSDTVRYKALGNSMAVPVMRRIGERIIIFDDRSM